jgi:hypothetical protein
MRVAMKEALRAIFASKMGVYIFLTFVLAGLLYVAKNLDMLEKPSKELKQE